MSIAEKSFKEVFLDTYGTLSIIQKRIWKFLIRGTNKFRHVFPSQSTIAENCGCSRCTVNRVLKKFAAWGWLYQKNRCYRSSSYFLTEELVPIDLEKDTVYKSKNSTQKATVSATQHATQHATLYNTYRTNEAVSLERTTSKNNVQEFHSPEAKAILQPIRELTSKDISILSRYELRYLHLSVEDYKTRRAKDPIRNVGAWITSRCKSYQQKYSN